MSPPLKIGVALGSGAARGFASIGVLRVLEKNGIKPTIVAGTSMGSLVGGIYAAGKLEELTEIVQGITAYDALNFLDLTLFGMEGKGGWIPGEKIAKVLEPKVGGLQFTDLEKKFGAVATDVATGKEVWLLDGGVQDAIRASISIPGVFTPTYHHGSNTWLLDGGIVNPVPVNLARDLGADFVIAINMNKFLLQKPVALSQREYVASEENKQERERKRQERELDKQIQRFEKAHENDHHHQQHHHRQQHQQHQHQQEQQNQKQESQVWDLLGNLNLDPSKFYSAAHSLLAQNAPWMVAPPKEGLPSSSSPAPSAPDFVSILLRTFTIMQDRVTKSNLVHYPPEIEIGPAIEYIEPHQLHRGAEAIAEGEKAAEEALPSIFEALEKFEKNR